MDKKEEKDNLDSKEEKALNTYIPIGVMIGIVIGMVLSFANNNIIFLGGGATAGLLIGTLLGTIATEKIEITKKEKNQVRKNRNIILIGFMPY